MLPRIHKNAPRLTITMDWGADNAPQGQLELYVKRVGDVQEFAVYQPISVLGSVVTFQLDELLFARTHGVFRGRLVSGVQEHGSVLFEYRDTARIVSVENPNV